jgi:hypothetical protein
MSIECGLALLLELNKESSELNEIIELDPNEEVIEHRLVQKVNGKVISDRKD